MATKAQLVAAFGLAWHVNASAIFDLLASDGSVGAGVDGAFANLTASGNVALGDAITDTIGLYGATPVTRPAGAGQAAVSTASITAVGTTASTTTTPFGYTTSAQADAIVTAINALITRLALSITLENQLRSDLVSLGALKGAA